MLYFYIGGAIYAVGLITLWWMAFWEESYSKSSNMAAISFIWPIGLVAILICVLLMWVTETFSAWRSRLLQERRQRKQLIEQPSTKDDYDNPARQAPTYRG